MERRAIHCAVIRRNLRVENFKVEAGCDLVGEYKGGTLCTRNVLVLTSPAEYGPISMRPRSLPRAAVIAGVNTPNRYTKGTSIGLSKGLNTNLQQQGNNQILNDVCKSR